MTSAWDSSRRRAELPDDWEQRRAAVFKRDGHRCRALRPDGTRCGAPATDCDHTGDPHDHRLEALQSLCRPCHQAKTIAERPASRRRRPPESHPGLTPDPSGAKPSPRIP